MKFTKEAKILTIIGVLTMGLFGCSPDNPFLPEQVINNALEKAAKTTAYYVEAELRSIEKEKEIERLFLQEWVSEDGKRRTEMQRADGSGKNIAVYDGTKLISYQPETNRAFLIEDPGLQELNQISRKKQTEQLLNMIQDSHEISAAGEEEIAGRKAYHLIAKAKSAESLLGNQELWIDKENWMILKTISTSGDVQSEIVFTKVDLNPGIPLSMFTLDLPENVHKVNLDEMNPTRKVTFAEAAEKIGTSFLYFPETDGLDITRIELVDQQGKLNRKEVNIEYQKNDLPYFTMTVFPSPEETEGEMGMIPGEKAITIRGQDGTYIEMGQFRSLVWQENGMNYSVIFVDPNLTLEEFTALTDNMIPVK
ncbi:conserved exported hypothetical protein [[Clostridium] ultunense Esp]|nr:conserved exported hypothetical protein [[Clostridium] ultunense Esp]